MLQINLHLQGTRKNVKAMNIVRFLSTLEMLEKLGCTKPITLCTAQLWMHKLGYRWTKDPKGQYVDGHERADVVEYRQMVFIPKWQKLQGQMWNWASVPENNGIPESAAEGEKSVVVWFHDESTFYANDRWVSWWVHKDETAKLQPKGEGASLMVIDYVSADYGWLQSPDGKEKACQLFKAGKARDGYFTNEQILVHAMKAMDILEKHYPNNLHIFAYDNATTHTKCRDGALSARSMPKFTPKDGKNWLVEVNMVRTNGQPVHGPNGKIQKTRIQMEDAQFANGDPQPLYFSSEHPEYPRIFKGMSTILAEQGLVAGSKLQAQCRDFKCSEGATNCCCCRVLYCQPDFRNADLYWSSIAVPKGL